MDIDIKAISCHLPGWRFEGYHDGRDHLSTADEWRSECPVVGAPGDIAVAGGVPIIVRFIRVRGTNDAGTAIVNTVGIILIKNGATVIDGSAAGRAPYATIYEGYGGRLFAGGLNLNFASASDTVKLEVIYRLADTTSV